MEKRVRVKNVVVETREIVTYESLLGNIFDTEEECIEDDNRYKEMLKLRGKFKVKNIDNRLFNYSLIFIKDSNELNTYHKITHGKDVALSPNFIIDTIENEWIAYEYVDGADCYDSVEYYRVSDILKDYEELKDLIKEENNE